MQAIEVVLEADFDGNGSYETSLQTYNTEVAGGLSIARGMGPNGGTRPGTLTANLDNPDGTFTPDYSSSSLYGLLEPLVPIRVRCVRSATDYSMFTGYVVRYGYSFGAPGANRATIEARTLDHFLAESDVVNVTVSTSRDTDAALIAIMDAIGLTSSDRDFEDGVQDLPMHYAVAQVALDAMLAVVNSEMGGQFFVNADGQLAFENRLHRLGVASPAQTWGNGTNVQPERVEYTLQDEDYVTAVRGRGTVFRTGQADVEVFRFSRGMLNETPDSLAIAAGDTYERDFDTQSAVVAITAPVSSVDYLGNSAVDGSGTDKTSALTVTVTDRGAGRFNLKIKNTDASTVYVTLFRLRGQPTNFFADRPEAYFSLSVPGRKAGKVVALDVPFAGDTGQKLRDYAYTILRTYRYSYPTVRLEFAWDSDDIALAMLTLELGDQVYFDDTGPGGAEFLTNVKDWWYVEGIEHQLVPANVFRTVVSLTPSYLYRNLDAIVFDLFDRANASGDLGTSTSLDTWANDGNMDITSNTARANSDTAQIPDLDLSGNTELVDAADISTANWTGYWVKPAITTGVADPFGGTAAFSLASADHGGAGGNRSGILQAGALAAGTWTLEFWGKCSAGALGITYGFDDGYNDSIGTLTTTWQKFVLTYTIPAASTRRFQVYENTAANQAWQLFGLKVYAGPAPTDQVVEVSLAAIGTGDEVGVTCRKVDANNYYRAYVDKGSNEVILEKVVAGVVTELSSPAYTVGTTGEIKLMVQGSRLRVWVARRLYVDTTDSSLTTGTKVGLFARNANASTTFANFYGQGL